MRDLLGQKNNLCMCVAQKKKKKNQNLMRWSLETFFIKVCVGSMYYDL